MSAGLDAEQVATARLDLANVTNQRVFPVLLETAVFAFLSVLICVSSYLLISKGLHDRPNRFMFALTLVVYALSATQWGIDVAIMWNDLNKLIPLDLTGVEGTAPTNDRNFYIQFAEDPLGALNFILADCVALWRACAVWGMRKGMVISSAIVVVILVGSWVVFLVAQAAQSLPSAPASIQVWTDSNTIIALETFSYTFTAAANILPTAMIAYKAWKHRRDVRLLWSDRSKRSAVEAAFVLLIESGVLYSMFWIVSAVVDALSHTTTIIVEVYWDIMISQVSGIYLTLVIILVALQKSHLEQISNGRSGAGASLPFSVRVPQTTTGQTAGGAQPSIHVTIQDAHDTADLVRDVVGREGTVSFREDNSDVERGKLDEKSR